MKCLSPNMTGLGALKEAFVPILVLWRDLSTTHSLLMLVFWYTTRTAGMETNAYHLNVLWVTHINLLLRCTMQALSNMWNKRNTFNNTFQVIGIGPCVEAFKLLPNTLKSRLSSLSLRIGPDSYPTDLHGKQSTNSLTYATPRVRFLLKSALILNQKQNLIESEHLHHYKEPFTFNFYRNSL